MVCQQQEEASSQQARAVLEQGVRQHPSASHLKLELVQCILRESDTDAQIMKGEEEMKRLFSSSITSNIIIFRAIVIIVYIRS